MLAHRARSSLGGADLGWLQTAHHFSFADYHDAARMGWGLVRVWNDDTIAPHTGFGAHPHRDMEIITYVRRGAISHRDSLGNRGTTPAGDVQVMSAGTGIVHAEENLGDTPCQIFQIWLLPNALQVAPSWGSKPFPKHDRAGAWVTLASGDLAEVARVGALPLHSDGRVLGATMAAGSNLRLELTRRSYAYVVPALGRLQVNGVTLEPGDGLAVHDEDELSFTALNDAELVVVVTAPPNP